VEVVASLSQGRTAAAQCGLFTHKSVPVIFEPPCMTKYQIHSEKIILITEVSTNQCKNIQVLDSLEWSKGSAILQTGHCYQYRDQVPQLSLQV